MPFKSDTQRKFFGMCKTAEGRKKAKGKCPSQSVINEFFHEQKKLNNRPRKNKFV